LLVGNRFAALVNGDRQPAASRCARFASAHLHMRAGRGEHDSTRSHEPASGQDSQLRLAGKTACSRSPEYRWLPSRSSVTPAIR
jgi:hypothetical protein